MEHTYAVSLALTKRDDNSVSIKLFTDMVNALSREEALGSIIIHALKEKEHAGYAVETYTIMELK